MVDVVVVGGGVTGLFCAYYLGREGVSVVLVERGGLGEGSVHAAGLIEPQTFYQINTWRYLRDALGFARRGVLRFRGVGLGWLASYVGGFGGRLSSEDVGLLGEMAAFSVSEYRRLAEEDAAWAYSEPGLLELYEDGRSFEAALGSLGGRSGWRSVEREGYAGGIVFDEVGVVDTERFVGRMASELEGLGVRVVRGAARWVGLDGTVEVGSETLRPERTVVAAGVECRRLGVPVTAVGGVGYKLAARGGVVRREERPIIVYERSLALVWLDGGLVKATVGLVFGFKEDRPDARRVLAAAERFVGSADVLEAKYGFRPCSPDGLPVVGGRERLVVATGGFRLGWSFAPAIARRAVDLALGREKPHPLLSRHAAKLHSGRFA